VDVAGGDGVVEEIASDVTSTWGPDVIGGFGGFAAGLAVPEGYRRPVLMMTTDGVGTKCEVARLAERYDGIGRDLVAMLIDDLTAVGARPLAVTDYLVVGRLDPVRERTIIRSVAAACREVGCALLGGETAQHPGVVEPERFDLGGAAMGIVEAGREVTGEAVVPGDVLVGLASPNLRSNGFSLIRSVVLGVLSLDETFPGTTHTTGEVLLRPSVLYAPAVLAVLGEHRIHGMAHVTGGGIAGNLARVMPEGCRARVDLDSWQPPGVFATIADVGGIGRDEMLATFNMGVGFVLVVDRAEAEDVVASLGASGHHAWRMGRVEAGATGVDLVPAG
jgi:phosphoribosylformylglycinamidine cyclo-ligase